MPNSIEVCRSQWLNQVKEADFVRWRNTNRVTNLRRVDLEAGWDGIVNSAYLYPFRWPLTYLLSPSLQTTLTCTPKWWTKSCPFPCWPLPTRRNHRDHHLPTLRVPYELPIRPTPQEQSHWRSTFLIMLLLSKKSSHQFLNLVRCSMFLLSFSISRSCMRLGKPTTLLAVLQTHLPLLFPVSSKDPYELAFPIAQGILIPQEAEVAWIASCLCGVDGWIRVGVCLSAAWDSAGRRCQMGRVEGVAQVYVVYVVEMKCKFCKCARHCSFAFVSVIGHFPWWATLYNVITLWFDVTTWLHGA